MKLDTLVKIYNDESGATAIEYGLIAALVSVAAIGALTLMGGSLRDMFFFVQQRSRQRHAVRPVRLTPSQYSFPGQCYVHPSG